MDNSPVVEPNFLYIGFAKAGSTWIYEALKEHPQIFVPLVKDIRFFENEFYDAERYPRYLTHFARGGEAVAVGELSHNYILSADCADRIAKHLPDVRLLVCLREPGDWLTSAYQYVRLFNRDADSGFEAYGDTWLQQVGILEIPAKLAAYYQNFPARQFHIMFYEDLKADPHAFAQALYTFLGVENDFSPTILNRKVNAARTSRFGNSFTQMLNGLAQGLREAGLENVVGRVKQNTFVNTLIFREGQQPADIPADQIGRVRAICAGQYAQLEALIGRALPTVWYERLKQ